MSAAVLSVAVTPYFPESFANPLVEIAVRSLREGIARRNLPSDLFGASPVVVIALFAAVVIAAVAAAASSLVPRANRRAFAVALLVAALAYPVLLQAASPAESPDASRARHELLAKLGY